MTTAPNTTASGAADTASSAELALRKVLAAKNGLTVKDQV